MRMLWLELTTRCQLACTHCYNSSGPTGDHGAMTAADWRRVIGEAADLGVRLVQFIGGEPTLHPDLADLITHARAVDVEVEVYSNLVHVPGELWAVLDRPGVRLATSFYSDDRGEHERITGRDTHRQTCANITRALEMGIPLRAGLVHVLAGQRTAQAHAMLTRMGVRRIGADHARPFGRGGGDAEEHQTGGLCGRCGNGCAAVLPTGTVTPCPMSRWMDCGNVLTEPLKAALGRAAERGTEIADTLRVTNCGPHNDGQCDPCEPSCEPGCDPSAETTATVGGGTWAQHGTR
ncbi:radical SAM/SPASM domain-containing protein [Actinomadura roseirufa]|uniref:radical SAM/SPASM domain-containing protein n=1 Tax=Actinomadura roseirufa TaxID=2094049 RepID=UPI001F5FDA0B|nr:radical SAM/SPASM domain-containing protein [Actinomadura roseirufa]